MAEILSRTRLPQPRKNWVRRQRALDALVAALDSRLILVVAGAGYGKTGLLAQFAKTEGFTFCWLSLDESERDLRVLGESIVGALGQAFPGFGHQTMQLLTSASAIEQNVPALVNALVRELSAQLTQPLCIVLDDLHLVEGSAPVASFLDRFISDLPDDVHLIIASRNLPPLQLGLLIAQQQVSALGQSMLRLDLNETRQLVASLSGVQESVLDDASVAQVHEDTEGWLVGLLMTSQVSRLREAQIGLSAPRAGDLLGDYLMASVLRGLPESLREFLYRSSILPEMSPSFCMKELKWADVPQWISEIERRNLFIQPVSGAADGETTYRYHPLFREFLVQRFKDDDPLRHAQLQRDVGAAYERSAAIELAVRHYLNGGWSDDIMRVIEAHGIDFLQRGRYRTVLEWFDKLDSIAPGARAERHILLQFELLSYTNLGRDPEALRVLEQLDQLFLRTGDLGRRDGLNIRRGLLQWRAGDYSSALESANTVIQSKFQQPLFAQCDARRIAALSLFELGRLDQALEMVADAERVIQSGGGPTYSMLGLLKMARYSVLDSLGQTAAALRAVSEAMSLGEDVRDESVQANALTALAEALLSNGESELAASTISRGLQLAEATGNLMMRVVGLYVLSRILAAQGKLDEALNTNNSGLALARHITQSSANGGETLFLPLIEHSHLLCVQAQRQQKPEPSARLLSQALALAREATSVAESGQSKRLRLIAHSRLGAVQVLQGDIDIASTTLSHAESLRGAFNDCSAGWMCLWQLMAAIRQTPRDPEQIIERVKQVKQLVDLRGQTHFISAEGDRVWQVYQAVSNLPEGKLPEQDGEWAMFFPWQVTGTSHSRTIPARGKAQVRVVQREIRACGFGFGQVWRNGDLVTAAQWGWNIPRELFFYMLTVRKATRDQISTVFWSDAATVTMQRSFHNSKFSIRQALGHQPFQYVNGQYSINPELDYLYDVEEFENHLKAALNGGIEDRLSTLIRAAELYQDDFMIDSELEWAARHRTVLAAKFAKCCYDIGSTALEMNQPAVAIDIAERAAQRDELNEDLARMLMTLQYRLGRRRAALETYAALEAALWRELKIRPDPATEQLAATIRAG
jgi:LuxR family maltose regulon positive regulatory protein